MKSKILSWAAVFAYTSIFFICVFSKVTDISISGLFNITSWAAVVTIIPSILTLYLIGDYNEAEFPSEKIKRLQKISNDAQVIYENTQKELEKERNKLNDLL